MENRLQSIFDAASTLFINKGYARTQMKDIAKELGLSTGMLYVYFTGKKALLYFLLQCAVEPGFILRDFEYPIGEAIFSGLEEEITAVFTENSIRFSAPLAEKAQDYPFEQMLSDAFDTIARYGTGCLLLEKNPDDVGKLGDEYKSYRREFFGHVQGYLEYYIAAGQLRPLKYPALSGRLIIETLSWWAMHLMNDAFEVRRDIPPDIAKEVCLDNLICAYRVHH